MMKIRFKFAARATFALALCAASLCRAQERPKVGLVLSGGAARGFAHIGVIKVLEEIGMPIDVVTGTSMGALLGGVYANGYTGRELEEIAVEQDWVALITRDISRRDLAMEYKRWRERYLATLEITGLTIQAPSGVRSGQEIETLLRQLTLATQNITDFSQLPVPFACVAMDIVTGEAVELRGGDLVAAMRASMAIPSAFTPVEIGDHLLADGGLVRNLPAQDARDLGADIIIAVDVADRPKPREELRSLFDIFAQLSALRLRESNLEQYEYCDVVISLELEGMAITDFGKVPQVIDAGERAARARLPRLRALADSVRAMGTVEPRAKRIEVEEVSVGEVRIDGLRSVSRGLVRKELGLYKPQSLSPKELSKRIGRVYSSGYFDRVWYRIDPFEEDATLDLHLIEKRSRLVKVGLRYDSHQQAGLLLNTTFRNLGPNNSTWMLDAELSDEPDAETRYFIHTGFVPALGLRASAGVGRRNLSLFDGGTRLVRYQTDLAAAELFLGTIFSPMVQVGAGVRAEYYDSSPETGEDIFPRINDRVFPLVVQVLFDTTNETYFPENGLYVDGRIALTTSEVLSDESFTRQFVDQRAAVPVSRRMSILQSLYLGATNGGGAPLPYRFFLGGANAPRTLSGRNTTFLGLKAGERSGAHVQAVMLGAQYNLLPGVYVQLRWNAGNTFDEFVIKLESGRFVNGGGATVGARILNGMAEVSFATSESHAFLGYFTIGSDF